MATKKRVWFNNNTGAFSNSWEVGSVLDITIGDDEKGKARDRGWKLIEYECLNDDPFVFYDMMKVVTNINF
jgi:hypothetical protein